MPRSELQRLIPDASLALCNILDGSKGSVQAPIRSEIFGPQRFAQYGLNLGLTHHAASSKSYSETFFPHLKSNINTLREAHEYIGSQANTGYDISPAAEWLLDNFHTIEAQLKEVHEGLPRSYFRKLPILLNEPLAGLPRIYGVAWTFVAHTDSAFDEDLLTHFLDAYQESRELNLSEIWALPTTLRVVLIENLRRIAEQVATKKAAREVANICFDHIDTYTTQDLDQLLSLLNQRGIGRVFLCQAALRLQDRRAIGENKNHLLLKNWLHELLPDLAAFQMQQETDQAADNLSVSNAVTSLRAIGDADWPDIIGRTSVLMRVMLTSPVFKEENASTRDQTLHAIEKLAKHSAKSEVLVATTLLDLISSVKNSNGVNGDAAHWLRGSGQAEMLRALGLPERPARLWKFMSDRLTLPAYLCTILASLSFLMYLMLRSGAMHNATATGWLSLLGVALMVFPASEAVVAVINRLISESIRPQHLPRLALANGIPAAHRTMVVIPGMLTSAKSISDLVHRLQLHYLANPEQQVQFALLTDWADADTPTRASDTHFLDLVQQQIKELNALYPRDMHESLTTSRFIVLHRQRCFSETEQLWIGWERKRGKLELLVEALALGTSTAFLDLGEESCMASGIQYIVTLDSDTQLPPGRLRELVGVAAHPHNQPQLDDSGRTVIHGYGILQPRVATPLPDLKNFTRYHWLFAGQCGIDTYSAASSEVYQDLFSEGTFTGKGLLNVRAMHAMLSSRLPEDQVLSHDLLEGSMARCAAVTDINVIEEAPFHADVAASRVHRWTRGDWQLLPFLLHPMRYRLRAINCWKMFDNLRRSLVPPMSLAFLLLALANGFISPWLALSLVMAALSAGPLMGALAGLYQSRDDLAKRHFYRGALIDLARALLGGVWLLAQLLQQSMMALDAIGRALYRMTISRRHLLQWTTAAAAQAQARTGFTDVLRQHWKEPPLAFLLLALLIATNTRTPLLSLALCLLWAASPVWTWWGSRTCPPGDEAQVPADDKMYLQAIARDTWRLFERCVGAADNYLPPDNLQTSPHEMVAHRTSPTNMGLYLLSVACARQFGWIGTQDLLSRLEATLATLHTLQRHRGHFLNWYDTQTCAPLLPMYVSTVDSGNLSGHLLATAQACLELAQAPYDGEASRRATHTAKSRLELLLAMRTQLTSSQRDELKWLMADYRATLQSAQLDEYELTKTESAGASRATRRLQALAHAFKQLAWQADFSFLYNHKRNLFHIGYRVAEQQRDAGFYDLLASESRLTSLLAIAKGDVPVRHWVSLGRLFYAVGAKATLRSWSGSMFEYLMPSLVLDEPYGSVLHEACNAALTEQIAFATHQGVPWGISESAYAASDHTLAYQYAPQGVPRLALRRTPIDELVIAPYATALAAQMSPRLATANFSALESMGARGRYGFIEALDFSPARRSANGTFTPVCTFMAHHQGMSIVALANVVLDGPARRWGMVNTHLEAISSLLHERVPRDISVLNSPPPSLQPLAQRRRIPGLLREVVPGMSALEPTHVLSNGHYTVSLRANGAGWSSWEQTGITRWRDDALRDEHGSFFYLRRDDDTPPVSLTQHPAPDPAAHYQSSYHADRMSFEAEWPDLQASTTVWVSPEDDIEFRLVELRNLSDRVLEIELISAFEVTLSDARADEAHPAFTNLFVGAQWRPEHNALMFERKPRLPSEQGLKIAHFLTDSAPQVVGLRLATDRLHWRGRNHDASHPLASLTALSQDASSGPDRPLETGLDPVCVMAVQLRIEPHAKARLTFATAACDNDGTLRAVIDKYRQHSHVQRASLMSATLTGIRLRALRISPENLQAMQSLTTALVLSLTRAHSPTEEARTVVCDKRLLWRFGISGDRPIILVSAGVTQGLGLLRSLSQALTLWSWGNLACDLVVVNAEPTSYLMALNMEITAMRDRHRADCSARAGATTTGFYLLRAEELAADEFDTLQCLARVWLHADGRPLQHHVQEWKEQHERSLELRQEMPTSSGAASAGVASVLQPSQGQFDASSGEFTFAVATSSRPQRPWINVLANADFGAQISEAGGGYTWAVNSRLNQLTAWSNDPVADPPSEWFLLQDKKTKEVWSVAPNAWGDENAGYRIAHGQGYTRISHRRGDVGVTATWCVDAQTAIKQIQLKIVNHGDKTQHLRAIGMAEWLMGSNRCDRSTTLTSLFQTPGQNGAEENKQKLTALLCQQRERSAGFGDGTAFLAIASAASEIEDWTCDRRELFDARGRLVIPDYFGQRSGDGLDPCAALSTRILLAPNESVERVFLLGYAGNVNAAKQLLVQAASQAATQRITEVKDRWDQLLGATTVKTPDPLFNAMVNRWLLYQTIVCRLWSKAGFYQAGGATGFRDQLQDAMALAWASPKTLRQQIVLCASRQFEQGDVQHWWHAPLGAGVRTHFSDDLLWLAHACVHYVKATGDTALLDQPVPFLEGIAIPAGKEDVYYTPSISMQYASVYEHAALTLDHSLRVGVHGLPLMGSGDWNDGMNRVGIEGRGESVWLGWFLCKLVADFAPLAYARGDETRARLWEDAARDWKVALNSTAWDGLWFKRAFFDSGEALGSNNNSEARIDLIAQAWSVMSDAAPPAMQQMAMAAVETHLVDHEANLIKLLDPPLQHAHPSAGYIQAYPPGVRENGGQYSHAGVWALMAQAALATRFPDMVKTQDLAYRYFTYLSPAHRANNATTEASYGIEPYVMAGDVYSQPPYVGRGGWSWYTGAAAWLHRAAIESIFGLSQGAQSLSFTPCLPSHWNQAELTLARDGRTMHFILLRATAQSALAQNAAITGKAEALLLRPGQHLQWHELAPHTCFVIPLIEDK